ncbi:hypothetical protein GCM10027034_15160 [Ramlibacter solisilvae]|uniref:hypothetical protein n=1 Tax=Ramlibacter tataouinensis TaxID=94132 RepID=UPI0007777C35|nr:hypothetical protein [Ramlibacter tataouinensis]
MTARRHFWILLFALLLPFAQLAAAAHEVSHVRTAQEAGSKSGLPGGPCDICAVAAHLSGGAAASPPATILHPELRQVAPLWQGTSQTSNGAAAPFDSRAPPNFLLP